MADYNIFIHSVTNYESPTTPVQLRENADPSGVGGEGGSGGSGFGFLRRSAAFISNPDTMISQVQATTAGALSKAVPAFAAILAITSIVKKCVDYYVPYAANASGDYAFQTKYNNFFQVIHNVMTPFSTEFQRRINEVDLRKENAKNEQQRLLFGGTIYDSRYGRYL